MPGPMRAEDAVQLFKSEYVREAFSAAAQRAWCDQTVHLVAAGHLRNPDTHISLETEGYALAQQTSDPSNVLLVARVTSSADPRDTLPQGDILRQYDELAAVSRGVIGAIMTPINARQPDSPSWTMHLYRRYGAPREPFADCFTERTSPQAVRRAMALGGFSLAQIPFNAHRKLSKSYLNALHELFVPNESIAPWDESV